MARNVYEKEKLAHEKAISDEIEKYEGIIARADEEGRRLTDEENDDIAHSVKKIKTLQGELAEVEESLKTLDQVRDISRKMGPGVPTLDGISVGSEPHDRMRQAINSTLPIPAGYGQTWGSKTLGEQFVESKGYQAAVEMYRSSGRLPSNYSTGAVALDMKGTLTEGIGAPGAGTGGGLITVPQVIPGVVETLFQPLTVASLIGEGQTSSNTIRYVIEGTATSGAAGVAEAGTKPESTLGLGTKDEPIKKVATFLPVTEEMLEDAPAIQSYINGRLTLFVKIEEERQLLRGVAGGNEVQGILTSRNVPVYAGGTAAGNMAEQLFKAMNGMRGSAFVEPEWMILHPSDWQTIRLYKDTANQYLGGGPFLGAYGNAGYSNPSSNQTTGQPSDAVWGKQVYVTAAIGGAGTALVGTRAGATVFRRGGISVEASNSHSNFFQLNLVALRAEERLGLAVWRPSAFVEARIS